MRLEDKTLRRIAIGLIALGGLLLAFAGAVVLGFDTLLYQNGPSSVIILGAAIGLGWWGVDLRRIRRRGAPLPRGATEMMGWPAPRPRWETPP